VKLIELFMVRQKVNMPIEHCCGILLVLCFEYNLHPREQPPKKDGLTITHLSEPAAASEEALDVVTLNELYYTYQIL
jgi:hypothetical protein